MAEFHRIVIVQGHPDPSGRRLCHALAEAYAAGAREAGHRVRLIEIAKLDFPLLRSQTDFESGSIPDSLRETWDAIQWADHLVFFFPLWLGTMPALVKAFLEQVARPNYAFAYTERGFPKKLLTGRSARVVVTMGMPAMAYRLWYLSHGVRGMTRGILKFVGINPIRETFYGMVGAASTDKRNAWLEEMKAFGRSCR